MTWKDYPGGESWNDNIWRGWKTKYCGGPRENILTQHLMLVMLLVKCWCSWWFCSCILLLFLFILMWTFREVAQLHERLPDVVIACLTLGARYCVMLGALCLPTYAYHWNCWFGKSNQAMPGSVRLLSMLLQLRDRSRYQIGWIFGKVPIQKFILGTLNRAFMSMKLIQ